jgi:hypothetical protein
MKFTERKYKLSELPDNIKEKILSNIKNTEWSVIDKLYFHTNIIDDDTITTIEKREDCRGYALINDQIIVASLEPVEILEIEKKTKR